MKHKIISRRPYYDDEPDGLVESDLDFVLNNLDACVAFLEGRLVMRVEATWTKEWPTERGWYWFYGQTSQIVWDLGPHYIPVRVRKDGTGKLFYVGGGHFLCKGEGARGLWTPMVMPTPPTDYQIEEVLV